MDRVYLRVYRWQIISRARTGVKITPSTLCNQFFFSAFRAISRLVSHVPSHTVDLQHVKPRHSHCLPLPKPSFTRFLLISCATLELVRQDCKSDSWRLNPLNFSLLGKEKGLQRRWEKFWRLLLSCSQRQAKRCCGLATKTDAPMTPPHVHKGTELHFKDEQKAQHKRTSN